MRKKFLASVLLTGLMVLTLSPVAVEAKTNGPGNVNATNVELVKKVTLKGPAARGGKAPSTAATGILGQPVPANGNKYAIVVGIKDYPGSSSDLQYTVADANLMKDVLVTNYGFDNVNELIDVAATKTAIYNAIVNLKNTVKSTDEVVFYFSGHGAKGKADDGDKNNVDQAIVVQENNQFAFIWDGELVQWFSGFATNRIIFIFDSCLAGGMAVLNEPGRVVCMGSTINSMSLEGATWGGGHGQFTYYFAEAGMQDGLANVRLADKWVTVEEAFDYANANCKSQTPTIADGFTNDLLP
jgi:metacaspase-1